MLVARAPRQAEECETEIPVLHDLRPGHRGACHFATEITEEAIAGAASTGVVPA